MMCTKRSVLPVVIVALTAWALSGSAAIAQAGELLTVGQHGTLATSIVSVHDTSHSTNLVSTLMNTRRQTCVGQYSLAPQAKISVWQEAGPLAGLGMTKEPLFIVTEDSVFVRVPPRHQVLQFDRESGMVD